MITKDMRIIDIVGKHPQTLPIFGQFRMACLSCGRDFFETVADKADAQGINADELVRALNEATQKKS